MSTTRLGLAFQGYGLNAKEGQTNGGSINMRIALPNVKEI